MATELQPDEKDCPFCAETIKAAAILCRFCNRPLTASVAGAPLPGMTAEAAADAAVDAEDCRQRAKEWGWLAGALGVGAVILWATAGFALALLVFFCAFILYLKRRSTLRSLPVFCLSCHATDEPEVRAKGYLSVEILLWLLFIFPGVIYSVWRASSRRPVCQSCGSEGIIPFDSPRVPSPL